MTLSLDTNSTVLEPLLSPLVATSGVRIKYQFMVHRQLLLSACEIMNDYSCPFCGLQVGMPIQ